MAERQQGRGKRGWWGRANKDQPKPARPTGVPDEAPSAIYVLSLWP